MRRFYRKYFTMAAMTALCLLLSLARLPAGRRRCPNVEQSYYDESFFSHGKRADCDRAAEGRDGGSERAGAH